MRKTYSIGVVLVAVAATAFMLYQVVGWQTEKRRRKRNIADEGYETAADILYPEKPSRADEMYGPVLPEA